MLYRAGRAGGRLVPAPAPCYSVVKEPAMPEATDLPEVIESLNARIVSIRDSL